MLGTPKACQQQINTGNPSMPTATHAITSIITSNYIAQALTLYSYIKESNPNTHFLVLIIGEADVLPRQLPEGPEWMYWDTIYDKETRLRLASEYVPFELVCVTRGRLHHYLATQRSFDKWIMLDVDIGVLASLDPMWQALDSSCIVLTPHTSKPVSTQQAVPHEANILKSGLFNGGVVGMKRSETAKLSSQWLSERLEAYGHAYAHRQVMGLPNYNDFEFADQIWLNLMYLYFRAETKIMGEEIFNLGHWNLHQGDLEYRDGLAYFNGERVLIAHFSGLPSKEKLAQVSRHSQLYIENQSKPWAIMAADYLERLERSETRSPSIPYSYSNIQPGKKREEDKPANAVPKSPARSFPKRLVQKVATYLKSPGKIIDVMKLASWQLKRSGQIANSILSNQGDEINRIQKLICRLQGKISFLASGESNRIRKLRNKYQGNRCFIIATGPSLNSTNIQSLSNEYTFAVKSYLFSGIEKFNLVPTFFCWSDRGTLLDKISLFPATQPEGMTSFFPFTIRNQILRRLKWRREKLYFIRDIYDWNVQKGIFSTEADHLLHCSGSVVIDYCIPLAIYMGFNPIYLVGCDQNQPGGVRHFDGNSKPLSGVSTPWESVNQAFEVVKKYAHDNGIEIYNATNGGELDVFERISLEEVVT
jgi:lipopolysaccharide biosynthesis glycosyltransferase